MGDSIRVLSRPHKQFPQPHTKLTIATMSLEEIVAVEEQTVQEEIVAPQPDAGKRKGRKAAKKGRKSRKAAKKSRKSRRKSKKSAKKAKKSKKKMTKRQRRRAGRAANKRARGGRTIAQCVVAVMKGMKGRTNGAAIQRALAKKGIKVASFVLNKVLVRLVRRRVIKSAKGKLSLTGRRIPKAKARKSLRRNKRGRFMKAKKAAKKAGKKGQEIQEVQEEPTIPQVSSSRPALIDKLEKLTTCLTAAHACTVA